MVGQARGSRKRGRPTGSPRPWQSSFAGTGMGADWTRERALRLVFAVLQPILAAAAVTEPPPPVVMPEPSPPLADVRL
jgi:hypothetical protein